MSTNLNNRLVTKIMDNFGFVDDDVFFQSSVVEGGNVRTGDQVYVECQYSEKLPFNWNATKIKVLNQNASQVASTYLQHRMQQLQSQQPIHQTLQNKPQSNTQINQSNFYAQDLRNLIQKQQSQNVSQSNSQVFQNESNPQIFHNETNSQVFHTETNPQVFHTETNSQNLHLEYKQIKSNYNNNNDQKSSLFYNRQPEYNSSSTFNQITYTSTPGSAFVSPVLPFNQVNIQNALHQQLSQQQSLRKFSGNTNNTSSFNKRDNHRSEDRNRDDHKNHRDNRDRNRSKEDRELKHRDNTIRNKERSRERDRENRDRDRQKIKRAADSPVSITSSNSKPRRRYGPLHIPFSEVLKTPISCYDIKQKFDSNIHIPSDFKELQINTKFELNIQKLHKPLQYKIINSNDKENKEKNLGKEESEDSRDKKEESEIDKKEEVKLDKKDELKVEKDENLIKCEDFLEEKNKDNDNNDNKEYKDNKDNNEKLIKNDEEDIKTEIDETSIKNNELKKSISEDTKAKDKKKEPLTNKYGIKVLLLSLPSMNDIYDRVFGSDRDNYTTSKAYFLHFNKLFSFLCIRNHNDGHSLIGGKFDPKLDGFMQNNKPNLIQTAIRCVKQRTGIDLSSCRRWKHLCTFLYNRDDSPFYENVAFEYSNIFIPDVWTLLEDVKLDLNLKQKNECIEGLNNLDNNKVNSDLEFQKNNLNNFIVDNLTSNENQQDKLDSSIVLNGKKNIETINLKETDSGINIQNKNYINADSISNIHNFENSSLSSEHDTSVDKSNSIEENSISGLNFLTEESDQTNCVTSVVISELNELKVTELRARLEQLGHKLTRRTLKKADLVLKLAEILNSQQSVENLTKKNISVSSLDIKNEIDSSKIDISSDQKKQIEGNLNKTEVNLIDTENTSQIDEFSIKKRKLDELENSSHQVKKIKLEENPNEIVIKDDNNIKEDDKIENNKEKTKDNKEKNEIDEKIETDEKDEIDMCKKTATVSNDGFILTYGSNSLTVVSLNQALNHNKYDHFELQVVAEILKETLISHFCNYILSACFENKHLIKDQDDKKNDNKEPLKNNYVLLAFSYFDSCHCGYMLIEDLLKLLNNCGFNFSKRTWSAIFGNHDRVKYHQFKEPSKLYNFKNNFKLEETLNSESSNKESLIQNSLYLKDGNVYNILKLILQSETDEVIKAKLRDKQKLSEEKINQLQDQVSELETKLKKTSAAIKKQNDEICQLKREKELNKFKFEDAFKLITNVFGNLNEFIRKQDEKTEKKFNKEIPTTD